MIRALRRISFAVSIAAAFVTVSALPALAQGETGSGSASGAGASSSGAGGGLANTGSDTSMLILLGVALLVVGATLAVVTVRRRSSPLSA